MSKRKYYVSLQSREISQIEYQNNNDFVIYATDTEVALLRKKLNSIHRSEIDTFWRAHVPIMPYHRDDANDRYDESLLEAFQMIYQLGDDDAKSFMKESGLLSDVSITDHR